MKLISTKDSSSSGQVLYIVRQLDSNSQNQYFHIKMQHVYSNLILYLKTYSLESDEVSKFIELVQSHKVHTQTKNVLHNMIKMKDLLSFTLKLNSMISDG